MVMTVVCWLLNISCDYLICFHHFTTKATKASSGSKIHKNIGYLGRQEHVVRWWWHKEVLKIEYNEIVRV